MLPCSQRALILVLEHMRNDVIATAWLQPWRQCALHVCSNLKLSCHKMTSDSKMYATNPG